MNTITLHSNYDQQISELKKESVLKRFLKWTITEEENRIAWLGISITMMTALFFPVTMAAILLQGGTFTLIIGAMISLIVVVIPNLAALPTRYTIPAFCIGILMDILLIVISFTQLPGTIH